MNQKVTSRNMIPLLFGLLLLGVIGLLALSFGNSPAIQLSPDLSSNQAIATNAEAFDYEEAADISASRWGAMARFYEEQGLLTRDNFDYEQAAEDMAYRWQAMAEAYGRHGLLNYRDNPDDVMAYRWNAMARAYEKAGLLNDQMDPGDVMAFRWLAMARAYEKMGLLNNQ